MNSDALIQEPSNEHNGTEPEFEEWIRSEDLSWNKPLIQIDPGIRRLQGLEAGKEGGYGARGAAIRWSSVEQKFWK